MIDRRANIRRALAANPTGVLFLPFHDKLCVSIGETTYKGQLYTWEPYSGVRSFASQDAKYEQGRELVNGIWVVREPGRVITNAKGGQSPHNYACAEDWCLWTLDGEPSWPDKEDPIWQEFIDAVTSAGLRPGSEFGDVDHCELRINTPWSTIGTVFFDLGPEAAKAAIAIAMAPPKGMQS